MQQYYESIDYIFKVVIIGNSSTGKTSLVQHFTTGQKKPNVAQTIGVEFACKVIKVDDSMIKVQIWDTAGQERYRSVARNYFRNATAAIVVFDITKSIETWAADVREFGRQNIPLVLVGNKSDLEEQRRISYESGNQKAKEEEASYIETSAVTGDNVEKAFELVARNIIENIKQGMCHLEELFHRKD